MTTSIRRTALIQGPPGPPTVAGILTFSGAWTPGSITNLSGTGTILTATGVSLTMTCLPPVWSAAAALPVGCFLQAYIISTGVGTYGVQVVLFNVSGSTQTLGAGTISVEVLTT